MVPEPNLSKQHHNLLLLQKSNDIIISSNNNNYYGNYEKYRDQECFSLMMNRANNEGYDNYCTSTTDQSCLGSDLVPVAAAATTTTTTTTDPNSSMAEDESRTNSLNNNINNQEEAGSTSKQQQQQHQDQETAMIKVDQDHASWLQLSIGGTCSSGGAEPTPRRRGSGSGSEPGGLMIELDLLPGGSSTTRRQEEAANRSSNISNVPLFQLGPHNNNHQVSNFGTTNNYSTTSLMYFQNPGTTTTTSSSSNFPVPHPHQIPIQHHLSSQYQYHQQQEAINWGFRPNLIHHHHNQYPSSSSSSSQLHNTNTHNNSNILMIPQLGSSYFGRQFHLQPPPVLDTAAAPEPSLDFRVVNPPKRPHSGIWFMLQASQNQAKEPFLPQISKSFLRIRDGSMTVGLLIKYLVNKLRLDSESEIEIRCRGQQVLPMLTLQQVRDNIWGPTVTTLLPDSSSSTTDHLMVLHYARTP
ncbi:hypothetical protein CsatB_022585 [Cannabis sativa]